MNPNAPFPPGQRPQGMSIGPAPRDQALDELRVRYARGELDRNDSLERSADLSGPPIPDATLPGQSPAPDEGWA